MLLKLIRITLDWLASEAEKNHTLALHTAPEMYFGSNRLEFLYKHQPVFSFLPEQALKTIEVGAQSPRWQRFKVAHQWGSKDSVELNFNLNESSVLAELNASEMEDLRSTVRNTPKPYDWTFFTNYSGTLHYGTWEPTSETIPLDRLKTPDPILYFAETLLMEDELSDNGMSKYSVKLRVMPTCFYLLARHYLRIDHVHCAIYETRIFHSFDQLKLNMETSCFHGNTEFTQQIMNQSEDQVAYLLRHQQHPGIEKVFEKKFLCYL